MDPVWIGTVSAIGGASATGLFAWLKSIADNRSREREAEAQREYERNERTTQRDHERRVALLTQRQQQVREWRDGLAAAHTEYQQWLNSLKDEPQGSPAFVDPDTPDAAGTAWFQSLRPHLSDSVEGALYYGAMELHCDSEAMVLLTHEIARIEEEWLDEAQG